MERRACSVGAGFGCKPALLLFHIDLLGDADGVLCVRLRHGAAIHSLVLERTDACAEVENMRLGGLRGSVFGRDPVDDILSSGVARVLSRRCYRGAVRGDRLRLGGDVRLTGGGGLPRFDLGRACVHILGVLFDRWGLV